MSSRVLTLVGVAAIAVAVWVAGVGRMSAPASAGRDRVTAWVATAHQQGIVGYRDPAVAVSPSGRLVAFSEGRRLRVVPVEGGVEVSSALADGQVRHLTWIDDRRVIFEDGGAAWRWHLHEIGVGARPLWPVATLESSGVTTGVTLEANALGQLSVSPDGAGRASRADATGPNCGACGSMARTLAHRHHGPAVVAGVGVATEMACVSTAQGDGISRRAAPHRS
jgi:hypothetical protein